eukprot:363603-Chlamydomonas_euryale.AAC.3
MADEFAASNLKLLEHFDSVTESLNAEPDTTEAMDGLEKFVAQLDTDMEGLVARIDYAKTVHDVHQRAKTRHNVRLGFRVSGGVDGKRQDRAQHAWTPRALLLLLLLLPQVLERARYLIDDEVSAFFWELCHWPIQINAEMEEVRYRGSGGGGRWR